ncbi:MAG: hypothetical protein KJ961_06950, partial [Alphaproteobacteria bacterium]|nr:hypothetical protein [Alphaproteobacteria bacterium]
MRLAALILAVLLGGCSAGKAEGPDLELILSAAPAQYLSEYGLFANLASEKPVKGVVPYDLINPLFSDHALKHRFVFVPGGAKAAYSDADVFAFPVGTVLVKTFAFAPDLRAPTEGQYRVETRLLIHKASGWAAFAYIWNADGTEAVYSPVGGHRSIETITPSGVPVTINYSVPNQNQCKTCHQTGNAFLPIGPKARNLNHHEQLENWVSRGLLDALPASVPASADVSDVSIPADVRARAWLDINCAHCHKPDGSASNSGLWLASTETDPVKLGVGKHPVAAGRGAGNLFKVIVP